jgi:acetoin utilization deacetylase AcuC-like enzyme
MALRLYYCDHHRIELPAGHKFPMAKYELLRRALEAEERFELVPAPFAEREDIELVHDPDYVAGFLKGMLEPSAMRRIGFPWSEGTVRRTLSSVGGTVEAAGDALRGGFGGNLAGGTHHAFSDHGSGFCIFNDIAVAIRKLQSDGAIRRAAVLDLDVHQGDGTAHIFRDRDDVLTVSIHGANNFPFRKQASKVDVPLADGSGDTEYLDALERALPRVVEFSPEIVFFQSGVDGLASDTLGRLELSLEGLRQRDRMVMELCSEAGIPLVTTLGGGYSDPIEVTVEAHANTFRTAAAIFDAGP